MQRRPRNITHDWSVGDHLRQIRKLAQEIVWRDPNSIATSIIDHLDCVAQKVSEEYEQS